MGPNGRNTERGDPLGRPRVGHRVRAAGRRPVLVLSADIFNERSGTVIAVALTSREPGAGFPLTHEVETVELPKRSWVKVSQVRTLSTKRIGAGLGRAAPEETARVLKGLNESLGA